jgi:hypothetical protein
MSNPSPKKFSKRISGGMTSPEGQAKLKEALVQHHAALAKRPKPSILSNYAVSKWEIAGISVLPLVEAILGINAQLPHPVSETLILHAVVAVATIAAIVRASLSKKRP